MGWGDGLFRSDVSAESDHLALHLIYVSVSELLRRVDELRVRGFDLVNLLLDLLNLVLNHKRIRLVHILKLLERDQQFCRQDYVFWTMLLNLVEASSLLLNFCLVRTAFPEKISYFARRMFYCLNQTLLLWFYSQIPFR